MAIEGRPLTQLAHCPGPQKEAPSALPLALDATVFGSETGARHLGPYAPIGIDSYARTLPLGGILADALVLPVFDGGNMGVRRRQLHELMQMPDYDPLVTSGD